VTVKTEGGAAAKAQLDLEAAAELEKKSDGKWNRKMVRNWQQIWPELH
jgi:hypothetical protein